MINDDVSDTLLQVNIVVIQSIFALIRIWALLLEREYSEACSVHIQGLFSKQSHGIQAT